MTDFHSATMSVITVDSGPGKGPSLHTHPYEEVFVVLEGEMHFTLGDEQRVVRAGETAVAPPGVPHGFTSGPGRLRSVNIHASPEFVTEWL